MDVKGFSLLPIVARELQVASRRRETFISRFIVALLAIGIEAWLMTLMNRDGATPPNEMGMVLFATLSGLVFLFILVSGTRTTSDCLCSEKREGTLGFLFLTDLKSYDVVLGKMAVASVKVIYGMLALVPIMAIPLLLGGVSSGEFWRVVLVMLNFLFFSLALGILASAICKAETKAASLAILIQLALAALIPLIGIIHTVQTQSNKLPELCLSSSSLYGCFVAFDQFYRGYRQEFWVNLIVFHALGWVFLILTCRIVSRTWQDKPTGPARKLRQKVATWFYQSREERENDRRMLLESDPYNWRCLKKRIKAPWVWGVSIALTAGALIFELFESEQFIKHFCGFTTIVLAHLALKNWFTSAAASAFSSDRNSGAMELILSTPLRPAGLVRGQLKALIRQFAVPVTVTLLLDFVIMLPIMHADSHYDLKGDRWFLATMVFFLLFDLLTLAWVGMFQGLASKTLNRAVTMSFIKTSFLPGLVAIVLFYTIAVFARIQSGETLFPVLWWLSGIFFNVLFLPLAHAGLKKRFISMIQGRNT